MKAIQSYRFLALALLGLILITGCNQTAAPTASEGTRTDVATLFLQNSGSSD